MLDKVEFRPKSIQCDNGGMLLGLRGFNRNAYATNNTATTFTERKLQERGGKWAEPQHSQGTKHAPLGRANSSCSSSKRQGRCEQTEPCSQGGREPLWLCMKFTPQQKRIYLLLQHARNNHQNAHTRHNTFRNVEPTRLNFIDYKALYKVEIKNTFKIVFFCVEIQNSSQTTLR